MTKHTCPTCGATVPEPGAACRRCLMELAARPPTGEEAAPIASGAPRPGTPPPTTEELAPLFPELELLDLLGAGGMGAVYRARQRRLGRAVALKLLHGELTGDPVFVERFLREAQALAKLAHPGIVAVHDFGERGGRCYLVMEFVDGANLRQLLKQGLLAPRQALDIVRQLCEALQFAHDEGVVHRDIKPENVLVDRDGKVKIADFGLAKLVGQPASVTLTNAGQVMGTPHYMAPEQIERPRDVDHRADLFSLGVVFYEMLTGELPLGRFAPPSQRVEIDVRLDQIVLRTLEHERERRYQSAVEVRTDVEAVARGPAAGLEGAVEAALGTVEETVEAAAEKRFYLHLDLAASRPGWLVILLLAWLLVGVAFDLGPLALAGMGCAMLGLFFVLVRWRFGAEAPEATGPRWRQRLQGCVFGGLGLLALLVAHLASFERGTWHYTPRFQRAGEGLDLGWRANDVLLQRVGLTRSGTHTIVEMDSNHWLDHPDALLRVHPALFLGLAVLGLAAAAYGIRGRGLAGLRASLPEASVILGLWFGSLFLLHVATWLYRGFESVKVQLVGVREAHGSADDVAQALYAALIERGFEVQGEHHGRLVDAPSGADLARIVVLKATPGSPFERWELTWRGPRRLQPHLVLRIVSDLAGARAAIEVEGGLVERSGPEEGRWRAWLDELLAEATGG